MDQTTQAINCVFEQMERKLRATTRPPSGDAVFALVGNNCTCREPCGVCGRSHKDAGNPAAVFSESGALCESCAKEMAPALHRAALDLEVLHWLGDDSGPDHQIVLWAFSMLLTYKHIDWDNPPDNAGLVKYLGQPAVRARIDELRRRDAESSPVKLEEDPRKIMQIVEDTQFTQRHDDFDDNLPF